MRTPKRDRFFNHKIQKIAEELKAIEVKETDVELEATDIDPAMSPTKAARAIEGVKADPAKPLKAPVEVEEDIQELPKNWDVSSLKVDGKVV